MKATKGEKVHNIKKVKNMKVKLKFELGEEAVESVVYYGAQRGFRAKVEPVRRKRDKKTLVIRILESKLNELITKAMEEHRYHEEVLKAYHTDKENNDAPQS